MSLIDQLFRTTVTVITIQPTIQVTRSPVSMPPCTASRCHPLTGLGEACARNAQVPAGYKGPVGKLVI